MTTSDRPAVKRQIVSVLADALPGVQVAYAYPGGATRNEVVWLGDVTGSQELAAMGSSRLPRNDNWTLEVVVAVTGAVSEDAADRRCQEIVADLMEAIFAGDRLGDDFQSVAVYPGKLDGPNAFRGAPTEAAASVAELTLEFRATLRGANP